MGCKSKYQHNQPTINTHIQCVCVWQILINFKSMSAGRQDIFGVMIREKKQQQQQKRVEETVFLTK